MGKNIFKSGLLVLLCVVILTACCCPPPPPVSQVQLTDAKNAALQSEKELATLDAEVSALEQELQEKQAELENLKAYAAQCGGGK